MAQTRKTGARSKDKLAKSDYEERLQPLQIELNQLARWLRAAWFHMARHALPSCSQPPSARAADKWLR